MTITFPATVVNTDDLIQARAAFRIGMNRVGCQLPVG